MFSAALALTLPLLFPLEPATHPGRTGLNMMTTQTTVRRHSPLGRALSSPPPPPRPPPQHLPLPWPAPSTGYSPRPHWFEHDDHSDHCETTQSTGQGTEQSSSSSPAPSPSTSSHRWSGTGPLLPSRRHCL